MKKANIIYWIVTILFLAFLILTSVQDVILTPDTIKFMQALGYPNYFTQFIGVMKILGSIAILIPGYQRIKEWAYAGIFFDLLGATYSQIATGGLMPQTSFMLVFFLFFFVSYFYYHKRKRLHLEGK